MEANLVCLQSTLGRGPVGSHQFPEQCVTVSHGGIQTCKDTDANLRESERIFMQRWLNDVLDPLLGMVDVDTDVFAEVLHGTRINP
jgi:hypothetical protein